MTERLNWYLVFKLHMNPKKNRNYNSLLLDEAEAQWTWVSIKHCFGLILKTMIFSLQKDIYGTLGWISSPMKLSAHSGQGFSLSLFAYDCIPSAYDTVKVIKFFSLFEWWWGQDDECSLEKRKVSLAGLKIIIKSLICDCLYRSTLHLTVWRLVWEDCIKDLLCLPVWVCVSQWEALAGDQLLMGRKARVITVLASSFEGIFIWLHLPNLDHGSYKGIHYVPNASNCFFPHLLGLGVAVAPQCCHSLFAFYSTFIFINSYFIKLFNFLFEHGIYSIPGIWIIY